MNKPMIFNFFLMNCPSHIFHGSWRHPESQSINHTDLSMWTDLAKLAERGKMDAIFIADNFGMYEEPGDRYDRVVANGIQFPCTDPVVLISAMASVTDHVGFAVTSSTLQQHPSPFARAMATLDHATKGRMGWNVVTSFVRNAAASVGMEDCFAHDQRYKFAEEYVDVVYKLWEGSWDDGAIVADRDSGTYIDSTKVHKIYHCGKYFSCEGPLQAPPSPQRTPVLFQAGTSPAGQAFAAANAEGVFLISGSPEGAGNYAKSVREKAVAAGRKPDDLVFIEGLSFIVGSTEEEARRKEAEIESYMNLEAEAIMRGAALGIDLTQFSPDTKLRELVEKADGLRSGFEMVANASGKGESATLEDFYKFSSKSWRVVGTPESIADRIQEYQAWGIDGINVMYMLMPGTFTDFIDHVVPVLQDRGLMKKDYSQGSLREKLFPGCDARLNERHPATSYRGLFNT